MNVKFRISTAVVTFVIAAAGSSHVSTQAPPTDWNIGDVFVGVGRMDEHPGKYIVYSAQGTLKETLVDASALTITQKGSPVGVTTGCAIAPSGDGYGEALYTTSFYANRVMRFGSTHPHAATLATTVTHPDLEAIESIVFDNAGNYYVSGVPPSRDSASDPIPVNAFIFKYRRMGGTDVLQATYTVPNGQRGVDWLDLGADNQTFYYTSEGTKIHEFRPSTAPGGGFYREIQIKHPSGQRVEGTLYAMRALPPNPGDPLQRPSGFLVALHSGILRVAYDGPENDGQPDDMDGVIIRGYDVPGRVGQYFALNITPDAQSFWTATFQLDAAALPAAGHLFKFHISSGALTRGPIPVEDSSGARVRSIWGLCLKREYTAAANTCYETDGRGDVKLDANGAPLQTVCRVPEVCNHAGIDEDGDGKADAADEDCRNPSAPTIAVVDKTSAEGELVDASHVANTQFPITVTDSDGDPLTITNVTGLPSFLSWTQQGDRETAKVVITGKAPFGIVNADPHASSGYQIKVSATDGTTPVEGSFRWVISRSNARLALTAPASRTCVVGWPCDTSFTVMVNEPDTDPTQFTTIALPAGFSHTALNNANGLLSGGLTNYPFVVTGPASVSTTGVNTFNVCAVDIPVFVASPTYDPVCVSWTLTIVSADNAPPVLNLPPNATIAATSINGAAHSFAVTATDIIDPNVPVSCSHTSGQLFKIGSTVVSCSATDDAGNVANGSFVVTVVDRTPPTGACTATVNPSTGNFSLTSRINEDGFFVVTGSDAMSTPVTIKLGPYTLQNGETVKLTQSVGVNGVVFVNLMQGIRNFHVGVGDPVVTITDPAGNATTVSCNVPPKYR